MIPFGELAVGDKFTDPQNGNKIVYRKIRQDRPYGYNAAVLPDGVFTIWFGDAWPVERVIDDCDYPYIFRWGAPDCGNPEWIKRKDHRCRVLDRGGKNTCLLEFQDGHRMITSRNAIRRAK